MSDDPVDQIDTGSGLYRKFSAKMFPVTVVVLWTLGAGLCCLVWNDVRDVTKRVTALEAYREGDLARFSDLRDAIKEIQSDIKELLREIRK